MDASLPWFSSVQKNLHFPRNSKPNLAQYISERPEVTSHDEGSEKAKTTNKRKKQNTGDHHLFRKHP
jgi:hypothetical protein